MLRVHVRGRMSTFGGPDDKGVRADEGLALVDEKQLSKFREYFLSAQPDGTTGLARRLNPDSYYIACRWDYQVTPVTFLRDAMATVRNPQTGLEAPAKPVDWGPNEGTGRVADLSPGLARFLGLKTDDQVEVTIA